MKSHWFAALLSASLMVGVSGMANAAIYRCTVDTRTVYTDKPCIEARPVDLTNSTPPSARDRAQATQRASLEAQHIKKLEDEEEQRRQKSIKAAHAATEKQQKCIRHHRRQEWLKEQREKDRAANGGKVRHPVKPKTDEELAFLCQE